MFICRNKYAKVAINKPIFSRHTQYVCPVIRSNPLIFPKISPYPPEIRFIPGSPRIPQSVKGSTLCAPGGRQSGTHNRAVKKNEFWKSMRAHGSCGAKFFSEFNAALFSAKKMNSRGPPNGLKGSMQRPAAGRCQ